MTGLEVREYESETRIAGKVEGHHRVLTGIISRGGCSAGSISTLCAELALPFQDREY